MDTIKRIPTHPGDVLKEELECRKISQKKFSEVLGVSYTMLNEILNGKRPITSDFALMVEAALDINAGIACQHANPLQYGCCPQRKCTSQ